MKWKKFWLGLGGLALSGVALGSTILITRKKSESLPPPWWIPERPEPFSILTEELEWTHAGQPIRSHLEYICRPTQFILWNRY